MQNLNNKSLDQIKSLIETITTTVVPFSEGAELERWEAFLQQCETFVKVEEEKSQEVEVVNEEEVEEARIEIKKCFENLDLEEIAPYFGKHKNLIVLEYNKVGGVADQSTTEGELIWKIKAYFMGGELVD